MDRGSADRERSWGERQRQRRTERDQDSGTHTAIHGGSIPDVFVHVLPALEIVPTLSLVLILEKQWSSGDSWRQSQGGATAGDSEPFGAMRCSLKKDGYDLGMACHTMHNGSGHSTGDRVSLLWVPVPHFIQGGPGLGQQGTG